MIPENDEQRRREFLERCAVAALQAGRACRTVKDVEEGLQTVSGEIWSRAMVNDASQLWDAIEADAKARMK